MNIQYLQLPQNAFENAPTSPTAFGNPSPMATPSPMAGANDKTGDFTEKLRRVVESDNRTEYEGRLLFEEIKNSQFFETFNERNSTNFFEKNAFVHLCKRLKYEKIPAKKVVFKQNDPSNGKLYLIYKGEVNIVIKPTDHASNHAQSKSGAPSKTDSNKQDDPKASTHALKRGDTFMESPTEGNEPKGNKVFPSITLNQPNKSKFAGPTLEDPKEKAMKNDKNAVNSSKEGSLAGTPKSGQRKKDSFHSHYLSGFKEEPSQGSIDNGKAVNRSKESRRMVRHLKNNQPEQHGSHSVEDLKKSSESEARTKSLKAKLKAATNVTLGAIRFSKFVNNMNKKISEEEEEALLSLDELIRKYGKLENKIEKGAFFGERALFTNGPRAATIITNTECEFLVMNQRDFMFVSDNFDSKRKQTIKFMMDYIPDIENINAYEAVERILYVLQEKTYERGSILTNEGDVGEYIHILNDGTCEMLKNLKIEEAAHDNLNGLKRLGKGHHPQEHQIAICKIQRGVFVGEEILYDTRSKYNFIVKVTSAFAKVYTIHKCNYLGKLSGTVQTEIQKIYNSKMIKYVSLIRDIVTTKYPDMIIAPNNLKNKELGLFSLSEKVILKPKGNTDFFDNQQTDDKVSQFQRKERRAVTIKVGKPSAYFDQQDSPLYRPTPKLARQNTEDLQQKKHAMSPFMRAMVPATHSPSLKPAVSGGGMKAFNLDDDGEEQKGFMDSVRIADILNQRSKIVSRTESPSQLEYSSANKKSFKLAPLATKPRNPGLGINTNREINGSFGQNGSIPSTERPNRLISLDPGARISTFESDDFQDDRVVTSPGGNTTLQRFASDGHSAARIDSLFKRSQRKVRTKYIAINEKSLSGQPQMSAQAEYCYLSTEDLYLTQSSIPKTEKFKNDDYNLGKNDNIFKPKGLLHKGQKSHTKSNPALHQEHSQFLVTATPLLDSANNEVMVKEKEKAKQNAEKEESHSARLKRKHQIRLQLRSKRDRDSLQLQRNSSQTKLENKINSARGESHL